MRQRREGRPSSVKRIGASQLESRRLRRIWTFGLCWGGGPLVLRMVVIVVRDVNRRIVVIVMRAFMRTREV